MATAEVLRNRARDRGRVLHSVEVAAVSSDGGLGADGAHQDSTQANIGADIDYGLQNVASTLKEAVSEDIRREALNNEIKTIP